MCNKSFFTGYTIDGGYATQTVANTKFCFPLPDALSNEEAAPLLCAGLIGWRMVKLAGNAKRLGIYGFGVAAHLIIQVANYLGREVYAFTKKGDSEGQPYARKLVVVWAGASDELPPSPLDAALIFAPAGELVPLALNASDKGAVIVCGGIQMSDIQASPDTLLWEERSIRSVELCRRYLEKLSAKGVGCTRLATFWTNYQRMLKRVPKTTCIKFGWREQKKEQKKPLTILLKAMKLNIRKPQNA